MTLIQLAITLYQMGQYGNGVSVEEILHGLQGAQRILLTVYKTVLHCH